MQIAIKKVEKWSIEWSFKMSCFMLFSKKEVSKNIHLLLYGKSPEQVRFLSILEFG